MAEFCLDCWNEINGTNYSKRKFIMSKEPELCEECGELKNVIIVERGYSRLGRLSDIIEFFRDRRKDK